MKLFVNCYLTCKLFGAEIEDGIGGSEWRATTCGLALPLFCLPSVWQIILYVLLFDNVSIKLIFILSLFN